MLPPWKKYPEYTIHAHQWFTDQEARSYHLEFAAFFRYDLENSQKYVAENPEPTEWNGFYDEIMENPWNNK